MKRGDQSDVPTVCMETQAARIARKHERQLARRRVRTIGEVGREIDAEDAEHKRNLHAENARHQSQIKTLLDELERVGK